MKTAKEWIAGMTVFGPEDKKKLVRAIQAIRECAARAADRVYGSADSESHRYLVAMIYQAFGLKERDECEYAWAKWFNQEPVKEGGAAEIWSKRGFEAAWKLAKDQK